jgi:hypothetical protein
MRRPLLPLDLVLAALWSCMAILIKADRNSEGTAVPSGTGYFNFGWESSREDIALLAVYRVFKSAPNSWPSIDPSRLKTRSKFAL